MVLGPHGDLRGRRPLLSLLPTHAQLGLLVGGVHVDRAALHADWAVPLYALPYGCAALITIDASRHEGLR